MESAIDEAIAVFLAIEDHRADCFQCLPATEAYLRDLISVEELNKRICEKARLLFERYTELGPRVLAERES